MCSSSMFAREIKCVMRNFFGNSAIIIGGGYIL
jgi:hypothetical protein